MVTAPLAALDYGPEKADVQVRAGVAVRERGSTMEYMFMPLKRFTDFSGRSRRKEFWLFYLIYIIGFFVIMYLDTALGLGGTATSYADGGSVGFAMTGGILTYIYIAVMFVPLLAVMVRRAHDQNKSGWFILIPIYNLIMMFIEGTRGANRFGPDPKGSVEPEVFA